MSLPADIRDLEDQLDKLDPDAVALVAGLTDERAAGRRHLWQAWRVRRAAEQDLTEV